ncbi:FMN-dependent NADH-azoreductase [Sulfitobacter mediterraneus]|uniref:FMN-dependent NADH-azoreductase n=1 Tax=Sulfitobacter mediterraneus TaxID=83219 RepID=UPI0021A30ED6|nr:NAD(P)H-dependent oxidoreductase [Sulfitobacter mediterraneus]UWR12457.1 NAD(P)H-dependent oxidoreductase [Sulfitobacter mediterraneus]
MTTILRIDASVRRTDNSDVAYNSISRTLADSFVEQWKESEPEVEVILRDVGMTPPVFICNDWIASVFTPDAERTDQQKTLVSLSDTLIDEIDRADVLLISTPMYNYGMPAALKAWFDQVIRINKTFTFDLDRGDFPLEPIMSGKTLVLLTSAGEFGFEEGGIRDGSGHLSAHINTLRKYLGAEHMFEATAEYQEFADERHDASVAAAHTRIREIAWELSS